MLRIPRNKNSGLGIPNYKEQELTIAEARVNGGMVTFIDAVDIENNQFAELKNVYIRYDKTARRYGSLDFVPAPPDANKILLVTPYTKFSGVASLIRFTPSTVYASTTTTWNAVVGALTGGTNDRFTTVIADDRMFFTNNGVDYIQELNLDALTFARAGNAKRYKYITAFDNRIIGANLVDAVNPDPTEIGWSGNLNFTEWNPLVDVSAGYTPLIESPSGYSDPITGIFGFTEIGLLLRERSLYAITKQPIASLPFNFVVLAPSIGCDCPYSAVPIRNGICWFDFRTASVYTFINGMTQPESIGIPIENTLIGDASNINTISASYNTITDEYILCVPSDISTLVKMWTYNFRTKTWWYEEQDSISSVNNVDYFNSNYVIDDLPGTIDSLVGSIDSLTKSIKVSSRLYGKSNGHLLIQNTLADTDAGTTYTTKIVSKVYSIPRHDGYVTRFRIEYKPLLAGAFTAYYSKDGGITWHTYKTVTWTALEVGKRKLATFNKNIKGSQYSWKIESTSGLFEILEYEVHGVVSSADSRTR